MPDDILPYAGRNVGAEENAPIAATLKSAYVKTASLVGQALQRHAFGVGALFVVACLMVAYLPPERSIMPAHDFLDSWFVYLTLRARTAYFLNLVATIPILHGMSLGGTGVNDFTVVPNLFAILPPFLALAVGQFLTRSLGFVGLFLLLTRHILPDFHERRIIAAGASVLFALLPNWDFSGTILVSPLAAYALINLAVSRSPIVSWGIIICVPLFWNFSVGGFVIISVFAAVSVYTILAGKVYWRSVTAAAVLLAVLGAAFEYRTIWLLFFSGFTAHRVEWQPWPWESQATIADFLVSLKNNILFGQYHNASGQFPVPLFATAAALVVLVWSARRRKSDHTASLFLGLVAVSLLISVLYAAEESGLTKFAFWFPVPFQVSRLTVLHPLIIPTAFALAASILCLRLPRFSWPLSVSFALMAAIQAIFTAHSLSPKLADALGIARCSPLQTVADCSQTEMLEYYRTDQYRRIAQQIGRAQDSYWVASLDLDPMVAAYNGFQTIDGYADIYSLHYKHKFEPIIARELDRNKSLSDYFRKWGSRAYLFHTPGLPLLIDFCEALKVGAEYVLTPMDLNAREELRLVASAGNVRSYEIIRARCEPGK